MFTTVAFMVSVDASAALTNITPAVDDHIHVAGNFIYIPNFASKLLGAYAAGVTPVRAQLRSPSLRMMYNAELEPMGAALEPGIPQELIDLFESPYDLKVGEPMEGLIQAGAGAQVNVIIAFLGDGPAVRDRRPHITIRATGGSAAVANTWTNSALTFSDSLPAGEYDIVGFKAMSTTMVSCRLFVPGSFMRPGVLGVDAVTDAQAWRFRHGNAGILGHFIHDTPPVAQVLCTAADAANTQFFWLDLVKTA